MRQGLALEICEFHQVIFRPTKPLKLTGSRFPERSANFYSVLSSENSLKLSPIQYWGPQDPTTVTATRTSQKQ